MTLFERLALGGSALAMAGGGFALATGYPWLRLWMGWEEEAGASSIIGSVSSSEGEVRRKPRRSWGFAALESAQPLAGGDLVVTGPGGRVRLALHQVGELRLEERTLVVLREVSGPDGAPAALQIQVVGGRAHLQRAPGATFRAVRWVDADGKVRRVEGASATGTAPATEVEELAFAADDYVPPIAEPAVLATPSPSPSPAPVASPLPAPAPSPSVSPSPPAPIPTAQWIWDPAGPIQAPARWSKGGLSPPTFTLRGRWSRSPASPASARACRVVVLGPKGELARLSLEGPATGGVRGGIGSAVWRPTAPGAFRGLLECPGGDATVPAWRSSELGLVAPELLTGLVPKFEPVMIGGGKARSGDDEEIFAVRLRWQPEGGAEPGALRSLAEGIAVQVATDREFRHAVTAARLPADPEGRLGAEFARGRAFDGEIFYRLEGKLAGAWVVRSEARSFRFRFVPPDPTLPKPGARLSIPPDEDAVQALLTWKSTLYTEAYEIQWARGKGPLAEDATITSSSTNFLRLPLDRTGDHAWRVRARAGDARSAWSSTVVFEVTEAGTR